MFKKITRLLSEKLAQYQSVNIDYYLQSKARNESGDYVSLNMTNAKRIYNKFDILRYASLEAKDSGLVCEFGVFQGETLKSLAKYNPTRKIYGFDSFQGLPSKWRPGFEAGAFKTKTPTFHEKNIHLVVGLFNESLPNFVATHDEKISLLHIDCDLYESTMCVFSNMWEKLTDSCIIVFDEYFNYPQWQEHEHKALIETLATNNANVEYIAYNPNGEQVAVRLIKNKRNG